jgi:hypothetical protein
MKDGRTHLAHKAEHAVDLDTGAVVAVTLQAADEGDTTTLDETLCEAGMAVAELARREAELQPDDKPKINVDGIEELVADKGYHSGAVVQRMKSYWRPQLHSREAAEGAAQLAGQGRATTGGVSESAAGARQLRQELTQTARRIGRAQLCPLLRDRRAATLPPARAREHSEAAVGPRWGLQSEPGPAQTAGRGHAARAEKSSRKPHFASALGNCLPVFSADRVGTATGFPQPPLPQSIAPSSYAQGRAEIRPIAPRAAKEAQRMGTPSRSNREGLVSVMNDHLIRLNLSRVVAPIALWFGSS